jgi:hypothetical protein
MALIVENGTVVANADSYISLADAKTYHTAHDDPTAWTGATDALLESALKYAAATLDGMFDWQGQIVNTLQVLAWPRAGSEDREGRTPSNSTIPQQLKDAQCELAAIHLSSALTTTYDRGGMVKSEQAGPVKVEYQDGAPSEATWPYLLRLLNGLALHVSTVSVDMDRA